MRLGSETLDAVRAAVGAVRDPELRRPLAELGMLRSVQAGRAGSVTIDVALTTRGCPMTSQIRMDVARAAASVAGVRDVNVQFSIMDEAERARVGATAVTTRRDASPARAVYAVASGKGGVGKSSIAANLAIALTQSGRRVGLIDADVWGYSVPQLFGVRRAPVVLNEKMLPIDAFGVSLMSLGFFVEENEPVIWRGPMLHKALTQFVNETHWNDLDVLLIDLPPGTGDVTLSVLELLPDASLVAITTPQVAARAVASRVGAMAREVQMPVAGVIENMSELVCDTCQARTPLFGIGGGHQLADELQTGLLGQIPLDVALRIGGDAGTPVLVGAPHSASADAIREIGRRLRPVRRPLAGRQLGLTPVAR